jgi:hypothetical protein
MRIYESGKNRSIAEIMNVGVSDFGLRCDLVGGYNCADLFPLHYDCGGPDSLRSNYPPGEKGAQTHGLNPPSLASMS